MNTKEIIRRTASQTIAIEIATLEMLQASINDDFVACVEAIYQSPGRLVVTGIGKSAIVAQKIVATLNSTGTPALFMHAADAIHGDLGMVRPYDLVLCLSKSGETAEIKVLAPLVRNLGNVLIGMTAKQDSFLARQANFLLHTPIPRTADGAFESWAADITDASDSHSTTVDFGTAATVAAARRVRFTVGDETTFR